MDKKIDRITAIIVDNSAFRKDEESVRSVSDSALKYSVC